jgi:hypothetical protein
MTGPPTAALVPPEDTIILSLTYEDRIEICKPIRFRQGKTVEKRPSTCRQPIDRPEDQTRNRLREIIQERQSRHSVVSQLHKYRCHFPDRHHTASSYGILARLQRAVCDRKGLGRNHGIRTRADMASDAIVKQLSWPRP